ncbi:MAG: glycosyltransferase family 2 protein, partial [bacterium]|nr:glycosyltransferase family 2 protein [bacterium]
MPFISVIIPTHNRLEFLHRAVDSVLQQDFRDFELIIIDDGSTDGTFEKFNRSKPPVRYYYQPGQGVSAARNR